MDVSTYCTREHLLQTRALVVDVSTYCGNERTVVGLIVIEPAVTEQMEQSAEQPLQRVAEPLPTPEQHEHLTVNIRTALYM